MNYETVSVKDFEKKVQFKGVAITPRVVNGSIEGLVISQGLDNTLIVEKRNYDFAILVPKRPTVRKYRLTGELPVLGKISQDFDTETDAIKAKLKLEEMGGTGLDWDSVEVEAVQ